jgi:Dna[CI] antecedent DciA-like protein
MELLIRTLPAILKAAGDSQEVAEAAAIAAWRHLAGEGLGDHAVAFCLYEKKLIVSVADGTWQKQLRSLSPQLLFRLNSILGQPLVTYIDLVVDPQRLAQRRPQKAGRPDEQLTDVSGYVDLLAASAQIQDENLRRTFLGAAISCINRLEKRSREPDL